MEKIYHPEVFMPAWFKMEARVIPLVYSKHAAKAAKSDRYGVIPLPQSIDLSKFSVVEIGVTNNKCTKIVVRGSLDEDRDVVYVFIPEARQGYVKTVWCNLKSDTHRTLKRNRYATS